MLYGYKHILSDIYSFIVYIKTYDIYKYIAEDVQTRFGTLNDQVLGN